MTGARLVVVLGMHRSGTSAITRALQVLHVDLGKRLMPPNEAVNARGFWEDLDIYELNVEMLHALGTDWYQASPIGEADVQTLRTKGFVLKAAQLLRSKMQGVEVFGFKDPRLGRLLPFWREVFRHEGIDVRYILALRNPMSVAASLRKRDGFETTFSYLLWWVHVLGSVAGSTGSPRIAVDFDRLMQDPRAQLHRIAALLDLPIDPDAMDAYAGEFLSDELRHSTFRVEDLRVDPQCPPRVGEYFEQLARAAADETSLDSEPLTTQLEQGSAALELMAPALQAMNGLQAQAIALRSSVAELQGRVAHLDAVVKARDEQVAAMSDELERSGARAAGLEQELAARDQRIAEGDASLAQREATLSELQHDLAAKSAQIIELQQRLGVADSQLAELSADHARQATQIVELQESLASRSEALAQSQRQVEEQGSRAAELELALSQREQLLLEGQALVARKDAEIEQARQELALRTSTVSELEAISAQQAATLVERERIEAELRESLDEHRASWNEFRRAAESEHAAATQALQDAQQRIAELAQRADLAERENREIRSSWLWRLAHVATPRRGSSHPDGERHPRRLTGPKA